MTATAGSSPPVIGLSTYREEAAWTVWHQAADLLPAAYAQSIEAAGGVAVLLPPQSSGAPEIVSRLDGLIITGGSDVDPQRYGDVPHPRTVRVRPDRDAWELALLAAASQAGLATLGICRGMQLMAVHGGEALFQHVPDLVGHEEHAPGPSAYGWTSVTTAAGSLIHRLVGDQVQVNCHHHQAVRGPSNLRVTAHADDGTVEAIEDPARPFWLGVQWHPETGEDAGLFRGLVAAATR